MMEQLFTLSRRHDGAGRRSVTKEGTIVHYKGRRQRRETETEGSFYLSSLFSDSIYICQVMGRRGSGVYEQ
jgi:hypothetical protein